MKEGGKTPHLLIGSLEIQSVEAKKRVKKSCSSPNPKVQVTTDSGEAQTHLFYINERFPIYIQNMDGCTAYIIDSIQQRQSD